MKGNKSSFKILVRCNFYSTHAELSGMERAYIIRRLRLGLTEMLSMNWNYETKYPLRFWKRREACTWLRNPRSGCFKTCGIKVQYHNIITILWNGHYLKMDSSNLIGNINQPRPKDPSINFQFSIKVGRLALTIVLGVISGVGAKLRKQLALRRVSIVAIEILNTYGMPLETVNGSKTSDGPECTQRRFQIVNVMASAIYLMAFR